MEFYESMWRQIRVNFSRTEKNYISCAWDSIYSFRNFLVVNFKAGRKIRIMAAIVIGAATGRVKNIVKVSYCIRVWRRAGSAIGRAQSPTLRAPQGNQHSHKETSKATSTINQTSNMFM